MRGVRVGEAALPGPEPLRVLVANVTSWAAGWRGLTVAGADVYCVQEARITAERLESARSAARRRGLVLQPGEASEDGLRLLAFAHHPGTYLRSPCISGIDRAQATRMQYAVVHAGRHRALHIVQLYGYADGPAATQDNERLVFAALAWLRSLGDVPALLVGDFNL